MQQISKEATDKAFTYFQTMKPGDRIEISVTGKRDPALFTDICKLFIDENMDFELSNDYKFFKRINSFWPLQIKIDNDEIIFLFLFDWRFDKVGSIMNVFSAFNGIGCGFVALERAGIKVDKYYSAEIDQRAIKVNDKNWPRTIQFGDITKIRGEHFMSPIDLLMGGSPCQDLSIMGKMAGLEGERSGLFYEFIRLKNDLKPKYFFYENVRMKKKEQNIICSLLGCEPIPFDSTLVSAQTRKRLYWTNIVSKENFIYPEDRNIYLDDILQFDIGNGAYLHDKINGESFYRNIKKSTCITARYGSGMDNKHSRPHVKVTTHWSQLRNGKGQGGKGHLQKEDGKAYCIDTACTTMVEYEDTYRKLTPIEVERCFNLPDNYTKGVSNSARYHGLGNGWEVATVVEFFKHLPDEYKTMPLSQSKK